MWIKLTVLGCLLLTLFVVHTAARIEHMNRVCDDILPLTGDVPTSQWRVPELRDVLSYIDEQIMIRRLNLFAYEHPNEELPPNDKFIGAPYSASEQRMIDRSIVDHANHTKLHWWVTNFGSWQYALAPLCFVWAIGNVLSMSQRKLKAVFAFCALLCFAAIFLMIVRVY